MSPVVRWVAYALVSLAAMLAAGWSVYVVARHYEAPTPVAIAAAIVFDGVAYLALALASEAASAGRSAFGARLAVIGMISVAVYLNRQHADLIGGGLPAWILFASPSLALLVVSELTWAGPRSDARKKRRGEQPYRPPQFGGWAWVLAPLRSGEAVRQRAIAHIEAADEPAEKPEAEKSARPDRSARGAVAQHLQSLDPVDAIRLAHKTHPSMTPAELAALLTEYGVVVTDIEVALVLGLRPPQVTVDRPAPRTEQRTTPHRERTAVPHQGAPQVSRPVPPMPDYPPAPPAPGAPSKAEAALLVRAEMPHISSKEVARIVGERYGHDITDGYVRNAVHRERERVRKLQQDAAPTPAPAPSDPDRTSGPYL
jgi:hypothetical protein